MHNTDFSIDKLNKIKKIKKINTFISHNFCIFMTKRNLKIVKTD